MKISKTRWKKAQEFELNDWIAQPDIVKKEWEEAYRKYHEYFTALEIKLNITNSWKILDVGCNITCISRMIKKGEHYGLEPLADLLEIQKAVPEVKVFQGMGENIPFANDFFDLVICRNVLDHTFSPPQVIAEINRVLKPNGYLLLGSYVYNPFIYFVKNLSEIINILPNVGHPHTYTMNSLENLTKKYFNILDRKIIYEGKSPNDFGKIDEIKNNLPLIQKIVLFINDKLIFNKWFVREYSLLCQNKKLN